MSNAQPQHAAGPVAVRGSQDDLALSCGATEPTFLCTLRCCVTVTMSERGTHNRFVDPLQRHQTELACMSAVKRCRHWQPFAGMPSMLLQLVMQSLDHRSRVCTAATSRRMLHEAQQSYRWAGALPVPLRNSLWQHMHVQPHSLLVVAACISLHLQLYHHKLNVHALLPHLGQLSHLQLAFREDSRVGALRLPTPRQLRRLLRAAPHLTIRLMVLSHYRTVGAAAECKQLDALATVSQRISIAHSLEYQRA